MIDHIKEWVDFKKNSRATIPKQYQKKRTLWINKASNPCAKLMNREARKRDIEDEILRMTFFKKSRDEIRKLGRWGNNNKFSKHIEKNYDRWI